jgi:hypothetical protein
MLHSTWLEIHLPVQHMHVGAAEMINMGSKMLLSAL